MATRAVSMTIAYIAWDTSTNAGKTGDGGNHTLRWVKDGTASAPTNALAEVDSTNCPGLYKLTLTTTEADCNIGVLAGKSSTASVSIMPVTIQFERLPDVAAGASGGVPLSADSSGRVDITQTAADKVWGTATRTITGGTITTNSDKTGYSLTQTFPTNFSSMAITAGGAVTAGTVSDKTGYSLTAVTGLGNQTANITGTITTTTNLTTNNDKTGYSIATGGVGTGDIDSTALNEIADAILDRVMSAGTDSGLDTAAARTVRQALRALRNRVAISAGTMTVYKENDSTLSWSSAITTTAGNPVSESNPT